MNPSPTGNSYNSLYRNFHLFFWPVLILALVAGFLPARDRTYLLNDTAPQGLSSLESAGTADRGTAIIRSWKLDTLDRSVSRLCETNPTPINRLRVARSTLRWDILFAVLYTLLSILLTVALQTRIKRENGWFTHFLLLLALLAGLCDIMGSIGMLQLVADGVQQARSLLPQAPPPFIIAPVISILSVINYAILGGLFCIYFPLTLVFKDQGLLHLSNYIRDRGLQLFRYRVILLSVLIFSIPIWMLDQGQDLLINSNSGDRGVLLFITVVMITAFLNWYLSKLFFEKTYTGPVYPLTEPVLAGPALQASEKKVSRMLGVCTIIIPAVAILHAMQVIRISTPLDIFPPPVWLLGLLAIFFAGIKYDLAATAYCRLADKWGKKKARNISLFMLVSVGVLAPGLFRSLILHGQNNTPHSLIYLFGNLVLLAVVFYIFVSIRTFIFPDHSWLGRKIGWPVILAAGTLAILFILCNIFPSWIRTMDCDYLSLPMLLSGIVLYILLFTFLIRISLWRKINFVLFFFIITLGVAFVIDNDYHAVRQMEVSASPAPLPMTTYFQEWVLQRKEEIDSCPGEYPVFLVNSYGGGIRAAAFTNMVLTWLDSVMIHDGRSHKAFEHFVFSVSGASGGTIGAALQCAYRAKYLDQVPAAYSLDSFQLFYHHDFLTPVLCNALGRDIWASMTGLNKWDDRSRTQEKIWEEEGQRSLHLELGREYNSLWDTARSNPARYEVPLLFSNTLNVDDGLKGVCAPVALERTDFPGTVFIRQRIDELNAARRKGKDPLQSVSLITGAFLSARFPFISPSGKMGAGYHFLDGGMKDNSGAATSESIFISLAKYACHEKIVNPGADFSRLMRRVRFYFVSITNSPYYDPDTRKLVSNRFEPVSPLVGIINSGIYGNARTADNNLQFHYFPDSSQFQGICPDYCSVWMTGSCIKDDNGQYYSPLLPLGWQISAPSLQRLRQSFDPDMIKYYDGTGIRKILGIVKGR